jgi:site-specific recombinase XerD
MAKPHLQLVAPTTKKRTVTRPRRRNAELRSREHLTAAEVERLVDAAKRNRWGHRDSTMILVAWRHGSRVSELVRQRKTTPIHELERYMRCREGKNRKWAVATQTGS